MNVGRKRQSERKANGRAPAPAPEIEPNRNLPPPHSGQKTGTSRMTMAKTASVRIEPTLTKSRKR